VLPNKPLIDQGAACGGEHPPPRRNVTRPSGPDHDTARGLTAVLGRGRPGGPTPSGGGAAPGPELRPASSGASVLSDQVRQLTGIRTAGPPCRLGL
jgi:hypothetical protein